ncbi:MAG: hypothetical protein FRX48_01283 [Lasallia pustulata]|uniref:Uncharacterized protein n=1 Tax=Lasallia pustulata TaxID=136370 RepID=A0A5M8Q0M9_9LECA|nr:MAG: hypothetical protein FRX48_01283 [Lasallia pustulata]
MASTKPKSTHVADSILQPFLSPTFDPTAYLNATLPPLALSATAKQSPQALSLSELAAQTQTHISQLSAQTSRLSDILTHLADDILRSGSRLAYEVERLRGEAISLTEALTESLREDITKFVPEGLTIPSRNAHQTTQDAAPAPPPKTNPPTPTPPPPHLPPPHPHPQEGQAALLALRSSITTLLTPFPTPTTIEAARLRVAELRDLATVWKGTAEERPRARFVDGLAQLVDEAETKRLLQQEGSRSDARTALGGSQARGGRASAEIERSGSRAGGEGGGAGFLRRLREEIYLE